MEYTVEDISPIKKKVTVSVGKDEVNASLASVATLYKDTVRIDGFRKGKVPLGVLMERYHDSIYPEAQTNLVNVHISTIMSSEDVDIVGGLHVEELGKFTRNEDYRYTIEFDTYPQFELPNYEGLEVEVDKSLLPKKATVEELLEHVREKAGKLVAVEGAQFVSEGQYANVDFEMYDQGKLLKDFTQKNFTMKIKDNEMLGEFEALVKTVPLGQEKEGEITFPKDFLNKDLQGKTVVAKVRLNAIKTMEYPEINDEFAKSQNFASLETLKDSMRIGQDKQIEALTKSLAQQKMVETLLKMVDFPLPPSLVRVQQNDMIANAAMSLERAGKSSEGMYSEEVYKSVLPQAEYYARSTVLLRTIAKKEGLQVTEKEVSDLIMNMAHRMGLDYNNLRRYMEANGEIFILRDRIMADKGSDLIFARGKYTLVEGKAQADPEAESGEKAEATENTAVTSQS